MQTKQMIIATAAGAVVGGIVAFLTAPKMGSEMRSTIKSLALKQVDNLLGKSTQDTEATGPGSSLYTPGGTLRPEGSF